MGLAGITTATEGISKSQRVSYIDWLRVLLVLMLIPFHTARIFDIWEPFYAKNAQLSPVLSYFIAFVSPWFMPMLFLMAGASSWFALQFRSGQQFAGERLKRLFIPLVVGILVVVPPQGFIARHQAPGYSDSYQQFYPSFFEMKGDLSGYTGLFTPGHLWFILYLGIFSLAALPLFSYFRRERGRRLIDRMAGFFEKPGRLFLLAIPFAIMQMAEVPAGKSLTGFLTIFIYGFILMADPRFRQAIARQKAVALVMGLAVSAIYMAVVITDVPLPDNSPGDVVMFFARQFNTWFWIIALTGYGEKFLSFDNRLLRRAAEGSYPFYILHQTVIVAVGYYVVQWNLGVWPKFAVIAAGSLLATIALYQFVISRTNVTRFLFGMKPKGQGSRVKRQASRRGKLNSGLT